jgi:sporulation protein YabP
MMDEKKKSFEPEMEHRLSMDNRESISLDGVRNVESFDDQEIILQTSAGGLVIKGRELHITQLNLDQGKLAVEGYVKMLEYMDDGLGKKGRGVFGRLLK